MNVEESSMIKLNFKFNQEEGKDQNFTIKYDNATIQIEPFLLIGIIQSSLVYNFDDTVD